MESKEDASDALEFAKMVEKIKHSFYGLLYEFYVMSKTAEEPNWRCILWVTVQFLQVLSFYLPLSFKSSHSLYLVFGWQSYTDWLGYVSAGFRLIPYFQQSGIAMLVFFVILLVVLVLLIILSSFVALQFTMTNFRSMKALKILRIFAELVFGPFYIPFLAFIFQWLGCSPNQIIECWGPSHKVLMAISIAFGVTFFGTALLYATAYYSRDPTSGSLIAQPHSRVHVTQVSIYSIYTVGFILGENANSVQWLLALMLFLGSVVISWQYYAVCTDCLMLFYYQKMPYFYWQYNRYHFVASNIFIWASVCLGINLIFPNQSNNAISLLFYFLIPIVTYASLISLYKRKMFLKSCKIADLKNQYEIELKGRFLLEEVTTYMRQRNKEFGRYLNEDATKFDIGYTYQPLPSIPRTKEEHEAVQANHERAIDAVEDLYFDGLRRFPVTAMALFRAGFCFCYRREIASALHTLSKAESFLPSFDESFSVFALRMTYSELDGANQRDITAYIQWQSLQEVARREDEKATQFQLRFWTELLNAVPDLDRLHEYSTSIHTSINAAHEAFKKLMKLNPNSEKVLRLFSSFLIDVLNRTEEANVMLRKADELEEAASRANIDNSTSGNGLLDDKLAIISIDGSFDSLGDVKDVNDGFVRFLGYSRSELLNTSIDRCMPQPFSVHHHLFLKRYKQTGRSNMMNTNNFMIALHKNGYLAPFEFFLREVSGSNMLEASEDGTSESTSVFIAVAKPAGLASMSLATLGPFTNNGVSVASSMKVEIFYVDASFNVTFITPGCTQFFGITMDQIQNGLRVGTWIEEFEIMIDRMQRLNESRFDCNFNVFPDGYAVPGQLKMYLHPVHTDYVYICQLVVSPDAINSARKSFLKNFSAVTPSFIREETAQSGLTHQLSNNPEMFSLDNIAFDFGDTLNVQMNSHTNDFGFGSLSGPVKTPVTKERDIEMTLLKKAKSDYRKELVDIRSDNFSQSQSSSASSGSAATLHGIILLIVFTYIARLNSFAKMSQRIGLSSGLRRLMFVLLLSMIAVMILGIVKFAVINTMMNSYVDKLTDVYYGSRMRLLAIRMKLITNYITYTPVQNSAVNYPGYYTYENGVSYQKLLLSDASELQLVNDLLVVTRGSTLPSDHHDLWLTPSVKIFSQSLTISGGVQTYTLNTDVLSLWNAAKQFITNAKNVAALNKLLVFDTEADTFFLLKNGFGPFFVSLNTSTFMYQTTLQNYVSYVKTFALTVTIFSILSIFLVVLFVIKPYVWLIEDNKHGVLLLFTEIPPVVIQSFQARCNSRLSRLSSSKDDIISDINKDSEQVLAVNEYQMETEIKDDEKDKDKKKSFDRNNRVNESTGISRRHWTLLRISTIVAICTIYFSASYWNEFGDIENTLIAGGSNINWGQYRQTQFLISFDAMRRYTTQNYTTLVGGSPLRERVTASEVNTAIDFFFEIQNSLAFGDENRETLPPTGKLNDLFFTSLSCQKDIANGYNPADDCSAFYNGMLNDGIQVAVLQTVDIEKNALNLCKGTNFTNFNSVNSTMNSDLFQLLNVLQETYLRDINDYSRVLALSEADSYFSSLFGPRLAALLIFLLVMILMFIFYFHPLIWTMNEEQKRTTSFLLLIPASVMEKIQSLRTFIQQLADGSDIAND